MINILRDTEIQFLTMYIYLHYFNTVFKTKIDITENYKNAPSQFLHDEDAI